MGIFWVFIDKVLGLPITARILLPSFDFIDAAIQISYSTISISISLNSLRELSVKWVELLAKAQIV